MFHQKDRSIDNFSKNSIRRRVYEYDDMEITLLELLENGIISLTRRNLIGSKKKKSEYNLQNPYKNL